MTPTLDLKALRERVSEAASDDRFVVLKPSTVSALLDELVALRAERDTLLNACRLAESVYRLNVVAPGEPSSVLDALQQAIRPYEPSDRSEP